MADEVQRRIAADGLDDLRLADGVVFQHLVPGPLTIGELAERLGSASRRRRSPSPTSSAGATCGARPTPPTGAPGTPR